MYALTQQLFAIDLLVKAEMRGRISTLMSVAPWTALDLDGDE